MLTVALAGVLVTACDEGGMSPDGRLCIPFGGEILHQLSWSGDGRYLTVSSNDSSANDSVLRRVTWPALETEIVERGVETDADLSAVAPGGDVYWIRYDGGTPSIWRWRDGASERVAVVTDPIAIGLEYTDGGLVVEQAAVDSNVTALVLVPLEGTAPNTTVYETNVFIDSYWYSSDGAWRVVAAGRTEVDHAGETTYVDVVGGGVSMTPDRTAVLYRDPQDGSLHVQPVEGGQPRRLGSIETIAGEISVDGILAYIDDGVCFEAVEDLDG